jgi:vacuolar protein sorting-associated protein 8
LPESAEKTDANNAITEDRAVFKWTRLRQIEETIFGAASSKAAAVLGAADIGTPTVLAANGMICLGTSSGKVVVLGFKQTLQCVCGNDASGQSYILGEHFTQLT